MLGVLSGGKQTENASFADMGIAVENMVMEEHDAGGDDGDDTINEYDEDCISISDNHSLVCKKDSSLKLVNA